MHPTDDIQLDDTLWPLLVVRYTGVPTMPRVETFLARMTSFLERGERHVYVVDTSGMTGAGTAEQRSLQAAWMKEYEAWVRERILGVAFVIHSPLVRLAVSLTIYLKPMPSPYVVTAARREALAWAAKRLDEDGQEAAARRVREHLGLLAGRQAG